MTNISQPSVSPSTQPPQAPAMRGEIGAKWNKLSATEIAAVKTNADLVGLIESKYGLDKTQAQRDVDTFAKGRQL